MSCFRFKTRKLTRKEIKSVIKDLGNKIWTKPNFGADWKQRESFTKKPQIFEDRTKNFNVKKKNFFLKHNYPPPAHTLKKKAHASVLSGKSHTVTLMKGSRQ